MSDHNHEFDSDADRTPIRHGQLSSNGHWVFGSIYAGLALVGFSFGVWAGAAKPKPPETADAKPKEVVEKSIQTPAPKQKEPESKPKDPEPKPEPVKPDPPKPDPPKPDPPKPPAKTEPPKTDPPKPPAKAVAFKEVVPLFRTYCGNCHGLAGKPKGGVDLRTVAAILKGGANGDILKAGDPMNSKLYTSMLPGASEAMPPDGKPGPSEKERLLIRDWIAGGAKERRRTIRRRGGRGDARAGPRFTLGG